MSEQPAPGSTPEQPLYFRWVTGDDGSIRWGRIVLALALTVATGYLSVMSQRAGSQPDLLKTLQMGAAQKRITLGVKIQRAGKAVEEAGWAAYEQART